MVLAIRLRLSHPMGQSTHPSRCPSSPASGFNGAQVSRGGAEERHSKTRFAESSAPLLRQPSFKTSADLSAIQGLIDHASLGTSLISSSPNEAPGTAPLVHGDRPVSPTSPPIRAQTAKLQKIMQFARLSRCPLLHVALERTFAGKSHSGSGSSLDNDRSCTR